jgi:hypothetical protein
VGTARAEGVPAVVIAEAQGAMPAHIMPRTTIRDRIEALHQRGLADIHCWSDVELRAGERAFLPE